MSTYYVDFSGWCKVEADSANEAEAKFWECAFAAQQLHSRGSRGNN